ncbi:THUMP domain-containing class I SAM-dependent RNA methyltransferase [Synechococcus elongatus]|uniref:THUMP domain-containing protein n=1 Tax=Synechococcus elongatus PCC 11801 TaxID=2219813 RepID=A0AAN1UUY7_SYNEL|nr:THUMP domain-containing protein [Synechococcus elongatus]AZB73117.1 RNA methyltransferase [Synechococcus elongatus PCC 11801]
MNQYFATVGRGLEAIAAQELEQLGAAAVEPQFCGVAFQGDRALLYKVNLWARIPFRILWEIDQFPCWDATDLYEGIRDIDWSYFLTPDRSFAVSATGKTDRLNHSHFTALQVKNAIVDQQWDQFGERSPIDTERPDLLVRVHLAQERCSLSLDSSGSSLHRRGYRPAVGLAPLKESLAAALLQISGWDPSQMLYDPLCGSGTLPLEAGLMALQVAPGLFRDRFGFESWCDFDAQLFDDLRQQAQASRRKALPAPIWGSDRELEVVDQAIANAENSGLAEQVYFSQLDLSEVVAPADSGVVICNPPYGERLGSDSDLGAFYKQLGDVLKQQFKGWTAFVLSGNKELARAIGLKSAQRTPVYNGGLLCQLMKYELY